MKAQNDCKRIEDLEAMNPAVVKGLSLSTMTLSKTIIDHYNEKLSEILVNNKLRKRGFEKWRS